MLALGLASQKACSYCSGWTLRSFRINLNSHWLSKLRHAIDEWTFAFQIPRKLCHHVLTVAMRLKVQALNHWDTCCSSWVWLSRKGSRRTRKNPCGAIHHLKVRLANLQVVRMCLIMLVAFARFCIMCLEQPGSSLMGFHPRMQQEPFASLMEVTTWMGSFGSLTAKPTHLWTNCLLMAAKLRRRLTAAEKAALKRRAEGLELVSTEVRDDGSLAVTGSKNVLTASQEYTPAYAEAVVSSYTRWHSAHRTPVEDMLDSSSESDYDDVTPDDWSDAALQDAADAFPHLPDVKRFG